MFLIDDSVLSGLNPEVRASLHELLGRSTATTPALVYKPVERDLACSASQLGGLPCSNNFEWPKDKNGKPMVFLAQVNFESTTPCNQSMSPKSGVLMLFISADYKSFRAKDQSWYRLIYEPDPDNGARSESSGGQNLMPVAELVPESIDHLRSGDVEALLEPVLNAIPERNQVLTWFKSASKRVEERLKDAHQICCSDDEQSREACVMAAFYANGISFDQARRADVHYKHLVDYAAEWEVVWRLGGLGRFLPDERRQLFICMTRENLAEFEFSKSTAVFL